MVQGIDVDVLANAAAALTIMPRQQRWTHLSLCVLDAVYSVGQRYGSVTRICHRYAELSGLRQPVLHVSSADEVIGTTNEQTLSEFLAWTSSLTSEGVAVMLGSRNRTSRHRLAPRKSEAARQYAQILVAHRIETISQAAALLLDESKLTAVECELRGVPGNGVDDLRLDYLWMLVGDEWRIKPDRMVRRWVRNAVGLSKLPPASAARGAVIAAAHQLGCTPWQLDHAIWSDQRRTG